jgi:hypothetical protein
VTNEAPDPIKKIPPEAAEEEKRAANGDFPDGDGGAAEAKQLSRGLSVRDLKKESEEAEHDRNQRFKGHFEWIALGAMWGISIAIALIGVTWLWHMLTPYPCHWLKDDQLERIQNIFAGVVLAGLLADHFRKRLS